MKSLPLILTLVGSLTMSCQNSRHDSSTPVPTAPNNYGTTGNQERSTPNNRNNADKCLRPDGSRIENCVSDSMNQNVGGQGASPNTGPTGANPNAGSGTDAPVR